MCILREVENLGEILDLHVELSFNWCEEGTNKSALKAVFSGETFRNSTNVFLLNVRQVLNIAQLDSTVVIQLNL